MSKRVIKKYGNRRLYDTERSSYINLDAVAKLVREGVEVEVVDARSGEDLTRHVLTQIIVESSKGPGGPPMDFLRHLVRATDEAQRDFFHWYLGTAADAYQKIRQGLLSNQRWPPTPSQWRDWARLWDPLSMFETLTQRPRSSAAKAKTSEPEEIAIRDDDEDEQTTTATDAEEELKELRQRLEQLEKKVSENS